MKPFSSLQTKELNKLECSVPAKLFQNRLWPYFLMSSTLQSLPVANTLAYFAPLSVTKKKSFVALTLRLFYLPKVIKLFTAIIYKSL